MIEQRVNRKEMKKVVNENKLEFEISCSCGKRVSGEFYIDDEHETLYCDCGLIWVVSRPFFNPEE